MIRIAGSILLVLGALVCAYLFLAGFEYPGVTRWKVVSGILCVLFVAAAFLLARGKNAR